MNHKPANNAKYNNSDYVGQKFGKLTVLEIIHQKGKWMWLCECECGNRKLMRSDYVSSGHSTTCGCGKTTKGAYKHGEISTRLYMIWGRMNERCNPNAADQERYKRYSGRGISVCNEWKSYENFAKWARENGYRDDLSIERIDNDGDYCPENCTWVTKKEQARNRTTTMTVHYLGRDMSLAEACEIAGMSYKLVWYRISQAGWTFEKAISTPVKGKNGKSDKYCKT